MSKLNFSTKREELTRLHRVQEHQDNNSPSRFEQYFYFLELRYFGSNKKYWVFLAPSGALIVSPLRDQSSPVQSSPIHHTFKFDCSGLLKMALADQTRPK